MKLERSAGILLHPTSLPDGRLGPSAYRFVDWLEAAGQSWWQVLPLNPPDAGGSPYTASSAFAASTALLAEPDAAVSDDEIESFVERHPFWIGDWASFRGDGAIAGQVRFEREWGALREYARARGVRLIGDLPIYVAPGSADHVGHPELFQRGVVGGVPPDLFSASSQLWGNPLYDWATLRATGYRWWIERFRRTFELVDLTRVDHFRAFVAYWSVDARRRTARRGVWRRAPGRELLAAARRELGELPLIAENLGVITEPVERLRREFGLPGMHVLQFGFGPSPNVHDPENHEENGVVYTGTHDNDTTVGWWASLPDAQRRRTGLRGGEPSWELIELALRSRARLALVPMQDVLGLGPEARMNTPGRGEGNWSWQLEPDQLDDDAARRLRELTAASGRLSAATRRPGRRRGR